jgi:ribonuclease-3 family protein
MILYNGETLAYVGDAIYELRIREYILSTGYQDVNKLHKYAVKFTSGENQAKIIDYLIKENLVTEEEISYFKRGRNSGHSKNRRSISVISYKKATGFEAMIGYLYLENKKERLDEILDIVIKIVEEGLIWQENV